jgi:hypothetical protein
MADPAANFVATKPEFHLPVLGTDSNQILPDDVQTIWQLIYCPGILS